MIYFRDLDPDTERAAYYDALVQPYRMRITVELLDTEGTLLKRQPDVPVVEGQVDVDLNRSISRQLSLTLAGNVPFDPDQEDGLYADQFIAVTYDVYVVTLEDWVCVPVFHGPITRAERSSGVLTIEAQSKESLMLPPVPVARGPIPDDGNEHHKPETEKVPALIKTLAKVHGESPSRFRMSTIPNAETVGGDYNIFKGATKGGVWPLLQDLAAVESHQLYYDAEGFLTLRPWRSRQERWLFHDGEDGNMIDEPVVNWDMSRMFNTVEVRSEPKDKKKKAIVGRATLPKGHPLSASALGRNGVPRRLLKTVKGKKGMSKVKANKTARDLRDRASLQSIDVSFNSLPIPHLEPGDLIAVQTESEPRKRLVELRTFTLPLAPGASMAIGFNAKKTHKRFNAHPPKHHGKGHK